MNKRSYKMIVDVDLPDGIPAEKLEAALTKFMDAVSALICASAEAAQEAQEAADPPHVDQAEGQKVFNTPSGAPDAQNEAKV